MISRYLIITALLTSLLCNTNVIAKEMKKPLVSVQLHSVKDEITKDFKGTLTALAKIGIDGVEFAGRFGPYENDPIGLKNYLDSLGLQASGAHVGIKQLRGEAYHRSINFYKQLGVTTLIIPHDSRVDNPDKIADLAKELTSIATKLKSHGLKLAYHNHAKEFKTFNGSTFWDYLAINTPDYMALQLDVGWSNFAKADSLSYVKRYPNRTITTHLKIRTTDDKKLWDTINDNVAIVIGEDDYHWKKLIQSMMAVGGTQWLVVEQEETHQGKSLLETVIKSINGLQSILSEIKQ